MRSRLDSIARIAIVRIAWRDYNKKIVRVINKKKSGVLKVVGENAHSVFDCRPQES